jgi:haloalkane dehalogenase
MYVLRTPDDRFADLPDFPFEPHYAAVADRAGGTLRMHYLDEGPRDAAPVLLMHGEPSWSYLYRQMVGPLVAAGHRVIAPDLVGFGRSDKPSEQSDYSYSRHVQWTSELVFDHLDLREITFFGQDWGGLVGLRLVTAQSDRFARVAIGNTGLPTGEGRPSKAFLAWQHFSQTSPTFPIGSIIDGGSATTLAPDVVAAYDAPFPDDSYKAGARIFPTLVPTTTNDPESAANVAAWAVLATFEKPFLLCFSDLDPITKGGGAPFLAGVPGTRDQPHTTIEGASHFLQEDRGPELAAVINRFIAANS